jgi:hypothetical protein
MFRIILFVLLGLYLIAVGLWPSAAAPVSLMFAGMAAIAGLIPGPVLAIGVVVAWLKYRPAPAQPATV